MRTIQEKLMALTIVELSYTGEHYTSDANAYDIQIRFVLTQRPPDETRQLVGYYYICHRKAKQGTWRKINENDRRFYARCIYFGLASKDADLPYGQIVTRSIEY